MENIGKYEIEEKIGVGGFGEVFKGYDPFIKRHVAVKTCGSEDPEIRDRFFREAEIAGNLHHKNITTVFDFGVHDRLPYLIQEYLSGEDLDAKIKRGDFLPYPEKLYYLLQIARGLAHAHSKGVIHRDIKPANIRILEDGTAKIMDFGIARLAQQESGLTKTGMTVGTAAYLAPEQVRGAEVDLRTDIFSYGVMAYELLTGERPFQGEQISTVIYQLLNHEPKPIAELWPAAPPEMVEVIDRCLKKDPGERFADGRELVRGLEALQKRSRGGVAVAAVTAPTAVEPALEHATQPVRVPPAAAAAASEAVSAPAAAGAASSAEAAPGPTALDDYSLPSAPAPTALTQPAVAQAAKPRFSTAGSLVILLLLAGVAAAAGWWFGLDDGGPPAAAPAADGDPPPALPDDSTAETLGRPADVPAPASEERPEDRTEARTPPPETEPEARPEAGELEAEPPPPPPTPPPPAPTTGKIRIPAVDWTDAMTLRLAGETYPLWRRHEVELPAGDYEAVFRLVTDAYSPAERRTTVTVAAGGVHELAAPIPPPGALTVRPMIGRPQGQVFLDDEPVGATLSKARREPGEYTIEIRPRSAGGQNLSATVVLEPGQELILTFDLTAGTVTSHHKELEP